MSKLVKKFLLINRSLGVGLLFLFCHFFYCSLFSFYLEKSEIEAFSEKGESVKRLDLTNFFFNIKAFFGEELVVTNVFALQQVAKDALNVFKSRSRKNEKITKPRVFDRKILPSTKVKETLEFIVSVIEEDRLHKRKFRILDPEFLNENFDCIKWSGDAKSASKNNVVIPDSQCRGMIPSGKIKLTGYAVFKIDGGYTKSKKFPYAIYKIIDKDFAKKGRFKYSKQDILSGILNQKEFKTKVKPLAWVTREGLEEAMMQGTVIVRMPNGKEQIFNIHRNNGVVYDKKIKKREKQKRYWYFRRLKHSAFKRESAGVVFAGDLYNIGLGKIIAIRYKNPITTKKEVRLGVLADCGGAFTNNLYQLDIFSGVFKSKQQFGRWIRRLPNTVEAYILVKR